MGQLHRCEHPILFGLLDRDGLRRDAQRHEARRLGIPVSELRAVVERDLTAYHEAGHAVLACMGRLQLARVTLEPDGHRVGRAFLDGGAFRAAIRSARDRRQLVKFHFGGYVAQSIRAGGDDISGVADDLRELIDMDRMWPNDSGGVCDSTLRSTERTLRRHWPWVRAVAEAVLERTTLSGADVVDLFPAMPQHAFAKAS